MWKIWARKFLAKFLRKNPKTFKQFIQNIIFLSKDSSLRPNLHFSLIL